MPRRCCIPGCNSNYDSALKTTKAESTFLIPKDLECRKEWLKAIPRANWVPGPSSAVCAKHFHESDIIRSSVCRRPDGTCYEEQLRFPRLRKNAVPCVFPNLPSYLSRQEKTKRVDPSERRERIVERESALVEEFLNADIISSFDDLKQNFKLKIEMRLWETKLSDNELCFYKINFDGAPRIEYSMCVSRDLIVKVHVKENELGFQDLKWILPVDLKLSRWSQLENLLSRDFSSEIEVKSVVHLIQEGLKYLKMAKERADEEDFLYEKELHILIDQLQQLGS